MKKIIFILFLSPVISLTGNAQISNYSFSAYNGTYTPITGTVAVLSGNDIGSTGLIPIGFTFQYDGTDYTGVAANCNGMMKLGATIWSNSDANSLRSLQHNTDRPILAPLWDDMVINTVNDVTYQTTGTAPNRIFTLQWANVKWTYACAIPTIEFQVRLYETSNKIEFVYNRLPEPLLSGGALIGITTDVTGPGTFICLQDGSSAPSVSSVTQALVQTKPATGQVYAFTRLQACTGMPSGGTTVSSVNSTCSGAGFTLSVNSSTEATGLSYQWQSSPDGQNWQNIGAASGANVILNQAATTYYRRSTACGTNTSFSTPVLVTQISVPVINTSSPTSFCEGGNITLTSTAPSGNRWYKDGQALGSTTQSIVVSTGGNYTVKYIENTCTSDESSPVVVIVKQNPATPVINAGSGIICQGSSLQLSSSASSGNQWYLNGAVLSGATGQTYTATQAGNYTVRNTFDGCTSGISTAQSITVNPVPTAPVATQTGTVLSSSASSGNQWYLDGSVIQGATAQTYAPTLPGIYTVKLTSGGCTSNPSNGITLFATAINSPELDNQLVIAPNPVQDDLVIRYKGTNAAFMVVVLDLSGKKKWAEGILTTFFRVDMSRYPAGYYVVKVYNRRTGEHVQKMILKK